MKYAVIVVPLLIAFAVSAVSGHFLIPFLRRVKAGQTERTDGPQSHLKKTGTPNMGGIMIILGLAAASLCMAPKCPEVIPVLFLTAGFGVVGFIDDYLKVVKKKSDGLSPKQKMALQIVIALLFALYVTRFHSIDLSMKVPFMAGTALDLKFLNIPALLFVAVATVNGTNFTDGVDGLSSCVTVAVALFFTIAAAFSGSGAAASGGAMIGALLGFLIYNAHPAKVFMGDTGSLALGGFVTGMAYMLRMPLFIPIVGFIYFIEVLSVIIQVGYFKMTHGKRVFRMAPIHHHYELGGWSEVKVVAVFTIVTVILGAVALLGLW
ncbi:MAG: phospho-N-acetylmuramoyl-pentapeptide-transferase [Lachnospiraceae bacterium]|nr:phospho-N-acetylmuramoyl-pentapeptide-transferase [Lachnospiraceae bacterium]